MLLKQLKPWTALALVAAFLFTACQFVDGGGGTGTVPMPGGPGDGGGDEDNGGGMPPSPYEVLLTVPECDANDPTVRIVGSLADWQDVNDPEFRVFCVLPGDYTAAGPIVLRTSGVPGVPRWIRYYDPTAPKDDQRHPVVLGPDEQAVVEGLRFEGVDDWVVRGLVVRGDWSAVRLLSGSERNVLDRLLIEGAQVVFRTGAHDNTLQNSVVRDAPLVRGRDRVCVLLSGLNNGGPVELHGTRIVNNEIVNCTDSIQLHRPDDSSQPIDFSGTIIDNNDLYLTTAVYSDCQGQLDPQGECACAENAVDIKAGGTGDEALVQVSNNRMWGFRYTDTACGGTGSWGAAVVVHMTAERVLLQDNRIWSSARGISVVTPRNSLIGNLLYGIDDPSVDQGFAIVLFGGRSEAYRNVVVRSRDWLSVQGDGHDLRCNVLIEAGGVRGPPGVGVTADYNFYFDTDQLALPGDHDIVQPSAAAAEHTEACFWVQRWTGPARICLSDGVPTAASPHVGQCDPALGSRPGVGVGD